MHRRCGGWVCVMVLSFGLCAAEGQSLPPAAVPESGRQGFDWVLGQMNGDFVLATNEQVEALLTKWGFSGEFNRAIPGTAVGRWTRRFDDGFVAVALNRPGVLDRKQNVYNVTFIPDAEGAVPPALLQHLLGRAANTELSGADELKIVLPVDAVPGAAHCRAARSLTVSIANGSLARSEASVSCNRAP